jgi:hypothetical protein
MSDLGRKRFAGTPAGEFEARIYLVGGPPDGDGDIILPGAIQDGHEVVVSYSEHDVLTTNAAPVGRAKLYHVGRAVHAIGETDESLYGRKLRENLRQGGPEVMWSIAWHVPTMKSRAPTVAELKEWPDARLVVESWDAKEISPVKYGSCGPACRTLATKCAGGCVCSTGGKIATSEPAIAELAKLKRLAETIARDATIDPAPDAATVADARRVLKWACGRLGVREVPRLRWFAAGTKGQRTGEFNSETRECWLSNCLHGDSLVEVVSHEVRHAWQHQCGIPFDEDWAEDTAQKLLSQWREEIAA